jgi:virginiamycin B lyase
MRRSIGLMLTAAALALPSAAVAAPTVAHEFPLSPNTMPGRMALGSDGNIWVVAPDPMTGTNVARVKPDGTINQYAVSNATTPIGITSDPTTGDLWMTVAMGLAHFSPSSAGAGLTITGTAVSVPAITSANDLVFGPDRNIWTAVAGNVLKITPGGVSTPIPVTGLAPRGITVGTDGDIYVGDANGQIVQVTTAGAAHTFATVSGMQQVLAGPNGQIAFSAPVTTPEKIGLLTAPGPATFTNAAADGQDPTGIAFGLDGAYWFANFAGNSLTRYTTSGQLTVLPGLSGGPRYIVAGPGGTLWVSEEQGARIAEVTGLVAPSPPATTPIATPPRPVLDTTAPRIKTLKLSRKGTRLQIAVTISEAGKIAAVVQKPKPGRRSRGHCVAPTRKLRHAKRCTRYVTVAHVTRAGRAGTMTLHLSTKRLKRGTYRVAVKVRDAAGNVSRTRIASLRIG